MVQRVGFSITLSEIIILISSVILASSFSAYAIYSGTTLQNSIMQSLADAKSIFDLRVSIVYATINDTTSPAHFVVYAKNIGTIPITNFNLIDVYFGEYKKATLYTYDQNASIGSGKFSVEDSDGDGVWEVAETAIIRVFPKDKVQSSLYEIKIVPYKGLSDSYLFAPP
ncbi:MAG: hypothetical protein QXI67_06425 [Candidatus Bathyarchaeia archaeon]